MNVHAAPVTVGRPDPSGSESMVRYTRTRDLRARAAEHLVPHLGLCGHESEVPNANDYVIKSIGPAIHHHDARHEQGKVTCCSIDAATGATRSAPMIRAMRAPSPVRSTPGRLANDGRLVGYAFPADTKVPYKTKLGLGRVTRVQSNRGFVFGSFAAEGATLKSILAAPKRQSIVWFAPRPKARSRSRGS